MGKYYSRINWENDPSKATPINAENLNKMDKAIEEIDNEVLNITDDMENIRNDSDKTMEELNLMSATKIDGAYADDDGYLYLTANGEVVAGPIGPFAGGTGGSSGGNNAALTVANTTGWISKSVSGSEDVYLFLTWSSVENDFSTGKGSLVVKVNGITKLSKSVDQGDISINVKDYLSNGANTVRVTISDVYGNTRTLAFSIERVSFSLSSPFDDTTAYSGNITFPYTPVGNAPKTMQFILDGTLIGSAEVTTSNRQQTFTIPAQSHGAHSFEVYFTAVINEDTVESNHLHYDIIFNESGNNNTVIASSFNVESVAQYYSVSIPWVAYTPNSATTDVEYYVNDELYKSLTVDRTKQLWTYRADEIGDLKLEIRAATAEPKVFNLTVNETDIDVEAEENDLGLYLSSYGRSNSEANPAVWKYGDIEAEFQNFNFVSDGWQMDNEQNTVLRLSGDARLVIPYQIFAQDFRTTGKTIEFELATRDVLNYDSVLLSCMSGGRGIEITTQMAGFKSEQSEITTKYKEEEHVRLAFVVEKRNSTRLLICYINGKISRLSLYPDDDDFSQVLPVDITIGSNDCITDIYNIRVYDNDLTRYQMLDNWIADTQNGYQKKERYDRNKIYDDYGQVTIDTLKKDTPYMVIICPVLPSYKGDKKTCSGYFVDPLHPERNFSWEGAQIDVQGTSSQYYYIKNFKIKYKGGFITDDNTVIEAYSLKGTGIGTNTFTMKADVASSEGWLNVLLAQLYDELCPVKTPAQEDNPAVRQTIDGLPMVIFWNNGSDTTFYGKFNFNNDKGTPEVFGFETGDESWEILQNGTDRVGFKDADFSGDDWKSDFEARYPEDNTDTTKLQAFVAWVASTDTNQATDNTLSESVTYGDITYTTDSADYRLAKYVAELPNWASVDALVFYYVFTFVFLCIDQREKNAFPTWIERMKKWMVLFYDADSSMGTDNKGNLAFDYWLEDVDYTDGGDPIFNGQGSVLWVNLRNGFWDKISAEYKRLRTTLGADGRPLLSYEVVMDRILAHVNTWCEAIYNEDAYKKYVEPYVVKGDTSYLGMAFGDKVEWAKYWLYNRFRYLDTLFEVGTSLEKRIMFRARAKGNVSLMSYINMYGRVYYNAEKVAHRMYRDQEYEFEWGATGAEDAVIGVNDADMITSLGDLSPLMVEYVYASEATHLTYLKVGDGADGYVNNYLNELGFGNNVLMRLVDARNCPKLAGSIDMSGCIGLEEAYYTGASITGLKLPNGCGIRILHLPDTITNLTAMNFTKLEDFQLNSYGQITTMRVENTPLIDTKAILESMPDGSRIRLVGFDWTVGDYNEVVELVERFSKMKGIDVNGDPSNTAELIGTINAYSILNITRDEISAKYPNIKVVAKSIINAYAITYDLDEHVTTDSDVKYVVSGDSFTATITPVSGYEISTYIVTMGGTDITSTAYKDGVIAISSETGDVDITAVGIKVSYSRKLIQRTISGDYVNDRVTSIGSGAFNSTGSMTKFYFPNVDTIGASAFFYCGKVTEILMPKLQEISEGMALQNCYALQKVDFGYVAKLPTQTLHNDSALTTLIFRKTDAVVTLGSNAILSSVNPYIYVPSAMVDSYKSNSTWSSRADYIRAIEDYPDICGEV